MTTRIDTWPPLRGFTTTDLAPEAKVRLWERHNAESLVALSCDVPADRAFTALEVNAQLDHLHLAFVRGSRHVVERCASTVDAQPADSVAIYAALRGEGVFEQAGKRHLLRPGHLLVCDADQPFVRSFGRGLEELAVKVPRTSFENATGMTSLSAPLVLDGRSTGQASARALVRMVGQAVKPANPVPADETAVLDLVSVLATGEQASPSLAHRTAAKAFIEDHLTDPALSAARVATATGVSERTLSRVFADAGTSVPRYILARRLHLARSLLSSYRAAQLRTADVAVRCGFTSTAYFAHTFKRQFGFAAGDLRRAYR